MLYRALIRTHHMTSRAKIRAISDAAKRLNCAVYLKTGAHPPGIMLAECEAEEQDDLSEWVSAVKNLHYKGFQHVILEEVDSGRLNVPFGKVREFDHTRSLASDLGECGVSAWWEQAMGYKQGSG